NTARKVDVFTDGRQISMEMEVSVGFNDDGPGTGQLTAFRDIRQSRQSRRPLLKYAAAHACPETDVTETRFVMLTVVSAALNQDGARDVPHRGSRHSPSVNPVQVGIALHTH